MQTRLPFEVDERIDPSMITAHAGIPLALELFRASGAADLMNRVASAKRRNRGLSAAESAESLFALWLAGGERCEDMDRLKEDRALGEMLGFSLPSAQAARDFLVGFHQEDLPLLQLGEKSHVPAESELLEGLASVNTHLVSYLQKRSPERVATLDVDATILESHKRSAHPTYDGRRGYQPVLVLWAEQDVVVAEEFRDGNVPAGSGNLRVVQKAMGALPGGVEQVYLRGGSALYEHDLMDWLDEQGIGFAISADMSPQLRAAIETLPEAAWQTDTHERDAARQWAEVAYVPDDGKFQKQTPVKHRYLAIRILKNQGSLFADGSDRRHFAVVTNRDGDGLDILHWQRGKAGTIEHTHDALTNDLAAEALPSQIFGANAAWLRLNVLCHNLISTLERVALPEEFRTVRLKRLRFLLFNTVGKLVKHARETLLRLGDEVTLRLFSNARLKIHFEPLLGE